MCQRTNLAHRKILQDLCVGFKYLESLCRVWNVQINAYCTYLLVPYQVRYVRWASHRADRPERFRFIRPQRNVYDIPLLSTVYEYTGTRQYSEFTLNNCRLNFYIAGCPQVRILGSHHVTCHMPHHVDNRTSNIRALKLSHTLYCTSTNASQPPHYFHRKPRLGFSRFLTLS
jgi:hypothetical protein